MSAQILIAQAIKAALLSPAIVGDRVFRDRVPPLPREFEDGIVVRLLSSAADRSFAGPGSPVDWATDFAIEVLKRVPADEEPADAIDPLLLAAYARLSGFQPAGLSVEDVLLDPRIEWEFGEGQSLLVSATFTARVRHRTQSASLAPWNLT